MTFSYRIMIAVAFKYFYPHLSKNSAFSYSQRHLVLGVISQIIKVITEGTATIFSFLISIYNSQF